MAERPALSTLSASASTAASGPPPPMSDQRPFGVVAKAMGDSAAAAKDDFLARLAGAEARDMEKEAAPVQGGTEAGETPIANPTISAVAEGKLVNRRVGDQWPDPEHWRRPLRRTLATPAGPSTMTSVASPAMQPPSPQRS